MSVCYAVPINIRLQILSFITMLLRGMYGIEYDLYGATVNVGAQRRHTRLPSARSGDGARAGTTLAAAHYHLVRTCGPMGYVLMSEIVTEIENCAN